MKNTNGFFVNLLILVCAATGFARQPCVEALSEKACDAEEACSRPKLPSAEVSKPPEDVQSNPSGAEKRVIWSSLPTSSGERENPARIGSEQGWVRVGSVPSLRRGYGKLAPQKDLRNTIRGSRSASRVIRVGSKKGSKKDTKGLLESVSFEQAQPGEGDTSAPDAAYLEQLERKLKELKEKARATRAHHRPSE